MSTNVSTWCWRYILKSFNCPISDHQLSPERDQGAEAEGPGPGLHPFLWFLRKSWAAGTAGLTTQVQTQWHQWFFLRPECSTLLTAHSSTCVFIRKYQELSQLYQTLQAAQSSCSEHIIKIKVSYRQAFLQLNGSPKKGRSKTNIKP